MIKKEREKERDKALFVHNSLQRFNFTQNRPIRRGYRPPLPFVILPYSPHGLLLTWIDRYQVHRIIRPVKLQLYLNAAWIHHLNVISQHEIHYHPMGGYQLKSTLLHQIIARVITPMWLNWEETQLPRCMRIHQIYHQWCHQHLDLTGCLMSIIIIISIRIVVDVYQWYHLQMVDYHQQR